MLYNYKSSDKGHSIIFISVKPRCMSSLKLNTTLGWVDMRIENPSKVFFQIPFNLIVFIHSRETPRRDENVGSERIIYDIKESASQRYLFFIHLLSHVSHC